ncbi:MAG: hypothetical protein HND50_00720 [Calditrichaeota bacterium]|nr:hypothetical protein [Calditrichota bacterium]
MNIEKLIKQKEEDHLKNNFIQFSDEEIARIDLKTANKLVEHFHGRVLMKLPPAELLFFEWLKKNDNRVWNDIWGDNDNLYLVSIDLLAQFLKEKNGFPICDLEESNYYFSVKHIKPKGLQEMERILKKTEQNEQLDIDELILFELHLSAFDIWHFVYRYDLPLEEVKQLISDMEYKGWIVHLPNSEDLLRYVEV